MAEASWPDRARESSWLDRPVALPWQRIAAISINWELAVFLVITGLAFGLRIWDVGSRAMHHDESLHAFYAWKFFVGQGYSYDPLMHGPLQFEVTPIFYLIFGAGEAAARMLAVILGSALVFLPYFLRSHLGRAGTLLASLMLGISPALVYFSRFIRDDIYLACFSLALFIAIVRFWETRQGRFLYIGAAVMALAMASMEAAYITFFIYGTFLAFTVAHEYVVARDGPVLRAIRATSLDTWLTALSIFVVLTVLLYSTFFTNPYGIWDTQHSILSPDRKDILGGLTYWKAQHGVQRGGQPWFYYLLVLPLYEQLAVVFGLAGLVFAFYRRTPVNTFLAWWALLSLGLYSWAGEKMPWLSIHVTVPFIMLGAMFLGSVLQSRRMFLRAGTASVFVLLFALETHCTFLLNYVDAANPTEMLIYVQTSQDVPNSVHEVAALSRRTRGDLSLPIGVDNADVGGWPYTWYLRDFTNVTQTSSFTGSTCGGQYCAALFMLEPEFNQNSAQLMKRYVAQKYRWNWWFPEDYKTWFPQHFSDALNGRAQIGSALGSPGDWNNVASWLLFRRPFGERGARWLYFLVRRDLVPHSSTYSTRSPATIAVPAQLTTQALPAHRLLTFGGPSNGMQQLTGAHGMSFDGAGNLFIADSVGHRVLEYSRRGALLRTIGSPGSGPGQFAARDSPQAVAVGPDGKLYVADTWNHRIEVFSGSGRFVRLWGGTNGPAPGQFYGPRSVAVSQMGMIYVADTGNKRIQVFNTRGKLLFTFGSGGTNAGQFQEPSSVAVDPAGTVYVADFWNQRIQIFSSRGTYRRSWPVSDWATGSYDEPYIAVDGQTRNVFAADPHQQRVLEYSAGGGLVGSFTDNQLTLPIGVAVGPGGRVSVADPSAGRVSLYSVGKLAGTTRSASIQKLAPTEVVLKQP